MKKALSVLLALLLMIGFTACGKKAVKEKKSTSPTAPTQEFVLGLKEDDHTIIWQTGNVTHVYTHDGTTVTGYTEYWDAIDAETAEETVAEVCESGKPVDKEYKSVTAKEQYIVIEYNAEYIPTTDYEEVVRQAENARQAALQGAPTEE